ncbi:hypothetical protein PS943_03708 [Pseudomonas fluorescens]|uniref:Uncharacterized protein n=1 Tax=Pseudomonas fluorescens TaxID=294 RepID=A0A5E7WFI9_PSEFL|nr:hypothetical protein PS943_03708 [Pseudomonas fluorescens]
MLMVFGSNNTRRSDKSPGLRGAGHGTDKPLLEVVEDKGYEAAQSVIYRLFHGQIAPVEGHVIRL